ncbi:MAG: Ser-Thr-rich GPI-anchored membrane family protein [Candidatus Odinarchaeota archaeon]
MKRRILILVGILFLADFIFELPSTRGITRDQTISTITEKDTYVNSYDPTSNFGGQDYALSGFYYTGDILEAYFFFNFSDKPTNYSKAEISLDFWSVSVTMNITVCLIEEDWDEYTMTWLTGKPTKGNEVISSIITGDVIYKFDVTNFITGKNNISICVYITFDNYVDDYFYITSREGFSSYSPEDAPQLIWTYPENAEITVTSPSSSDIWQEIEFYTIRWVSQGLIENVIIQLYKGSTFVEDITYTSTANDGEYEFYVSSSENYEGTDYRIKITDYDDSSVYDYSDYFSINVGSGTITVTSPSSSSSWQAGSSHYITWSSTGTIINVDIEIYKGNTRTYYVYDVADYGSYLWNIDEDIEIGTDWRIKISNSDDSSQNDWSDYFEIYRNIPIRKISGFNIVVILSILFFILVIIIKRKRNIRFF